MKTPPNNNAATVDHVSMRFGKDTVLHKVSIAFQEGQIHGIIGRNGSGKTVLFKCICGFLKPSTGIVTVFERVVGKDVDFAPSTGMLIEAPGFLPGESGFKNLRWLSRIGERLSQERLYEVMRLVGLDPESRKKVAAYSLGMRQRLGLAQALMGSPRLLILDEPFNGLDKRGVEEVRSLLLTLKQEGVTILLASHNPDDIRLLCDTVHEMDAGVLSPASETGAHEGDSLAQRCQDSAVCARR